MTSCPGTRGNAIPGQWPSFVNASLWQMPQAVGCIALRSGGGLVAALQGGVYGLRLHGDGLFDLELLAAAQ
ncbi:MAG: SMP-30/gluconolactonase/LRE family protein, partial [Gemmataceae bacterium]|nr:SMP-30/gluconolactonase/LRE family protein [Gemmataceae bacterium]